MGAVCTALDWLAFDDLLERAAHHGQSFQLLHYLSFLPAAFHVLFASSHVPRITFPNSQQEVCPVPAHVQVWPWHVLGPSPGLPSSQAQSRMSQMRNLVQTLVAGITPATRSQATPQALVLDTLCLLLDILAPRLRPVSAECRREVGSWLQRPRLLSLPPFPGEHTAIQCPREAAAVQPCRHHAGLQPHVPPGAHA